MAWFVRKEVPNAHFLMIGEGPMREEMRQLVGELRLENCVHLGGIHSAMAEIYPELDVLASTSRSEGMPLVVLEAMASGLPVVAFDVGGVAEIVESGTTGWIARPNDYEAVARWVSELLDSLDVARAMGGAARERVLQRFPLSTSVGRIAQVLRSLKSPQPVRVRGSVSDLSSVSAVKKNSPL
jgi:glycosyltransferase involved in cell wall biosynthesis